jgi:hypothetical protein
LSTASFVPVFITVRVRIVTVYKLANRTKTIPKTCRWTSAWEITFAGGTNGTACIGGGFCNGRLKIEKRQKKKKKYQAEDFFHIFIVEQFLVKKQVKY